MTKPVHIPPLIQPPPAGPPPAGGPPAGGLPAGGLPAGRRTHGRLGAALIVIAVFAYLGHLAQAAGGSHSWDRDPQPPATVLLEAGQQYLVSTVAGPGAPLSSGTLICPYRAESSSGVLAVQRIEVSARSTHAIGSFVAPVGGRVAVTCSGGVVGSRAVFIDDADDSPADVSSLLLMVTVILLLVGGPLVLSAGYHRRRVRSSAPDLTEKGPYSMSDDRIDGADPQE